MPGEIIGPPLECSVVKEVQEEALKANRHVSGDEMTDMRTEDKAVIRIGLTDFSNSIAIVELLCIYSERSRKTLVMHIFRRDKVNLQRD